LFSDEPCDRYAAELLDGKRASIDDLMRDLNVPAGSWFWDSLVSVLVKQVGELEEEVFRQRIEFAISQARELKSHRDQILSAVLNRLAECRDKSRHTLLLEFSLEAWKSPQLRTSTLWEQVSPNAKKLVCTWLAEEDLRDFYELCQGDKKVDNDRLEYWLRFKHQIRFSQIVLGTGLRYSTDADAREFQRRKKGRLAALTGSGSSNNAILMQLDDYLFVEFSETGNACYGYRFSRLPFEVGSSAYSVSDLKDRTASSRSGGCRLLHQRSWQAEVFDPALRQRGIYPDPEDTARSAAKPKVRISAAITSVISPRLLTEIDRVGGSVEDNRPYGGRLLVRLPTHNASIDSELRRSGFRWTSVIGYWLE
jgi:hypothetical protein